MSVHGTPSRLYVLAAWRGDQATESLSQQLPGWPIRHRLWMVNGWMYHLVSPCKVVVSGASVQFVRTPCARTTQRFRLYSFFVA